jgi:general secretion pathway protein F
VTLRRRIRFYQQLAVLMRAGLPIRGTLERLQKQIPERESRILSEKVNAGERLHEAFAAAGFQPFECHLVAAGDKSGHLDTVFEHMAEYWKRQLQMKDALIRPLIYPVVMLHFAVIVWSVIDGASSTPEVGVHHLIERLGAMYVLALLLFILVKVTWSNPVVRTIWLYTPLIGSSLRTSYAYRWITVIKLEFTAGVSLYRAVGDAWRASGYLGAERLGAEGEDAMMHGAELSKLMHGWRQLPTDWADFVETGEISGQLEEAFKNLEAEAQRAWTLAEQRMAEWLPKIAYFAVLMVVAVIVFKLMYQVEVAPLIDAEKQIDDATK